MVELVERDVAYVDEVVTRLIVFSQSSLCILEFCI